MYFKKEVITGILSLPQDAGADLDVLDVETKGTFAQILNGAASTAPVLPEWNAGELVSVEKVPYNAEVSQTTVIGLDGAFAPVASTATVDSNYVFEIGHWDMQYQGHWFKKHRVSHRQVLGNTADGRAELFSDLAAKINAVAGNNCTAYGLAKLTITLTASANLEAEAVGSWIFQGASLAAATWKAQVAKIEDWSDAASQVIYVYNIGGSTGTLISAAVNVGSDGDAISGATLPVIVINQGLAIVDDAGYYLSPNPLNRGGINSIMPIRGFDYDDITTIIEGEYSQGDGARMAAMLPAFGFSKRNLMSGDYDMSFYNGYTVDSTKKYDIIKLKFLKTVPDHDFASRNIYQHCVLYVDSESGASTKADALVTALKNHIGAQHTHA